MTQNSLKARAEELLQHADISIDGDRPTDIRVHNPDLYARVFARGSLGLGEAYMDGWWDVDDLPAFFARLLMAHVDEHLKTLDALLAHLKARFINLQRGENAFEIGKAHYDLGNELFEAMLGKRLVYSCGYWAEADNVDDAQEAKLDLVCRKLQLEPGQKVLDIGCGWGESLKFAAERYGIEGVGITVSGEQADYARQLCKGLPVEIRLQDYHDIDEPFDAVFSIGMFEHVGGKNYPAYFETVKRCLKSEHGLSVLHTIGSNDAPAQPDPWIEKYIFPNSMIPAASQVSAALEGTVRGGGLAQFRYRLRPYADGLAGQLRCRMAGPQEQVRRAVPPHVALLSVLLGGHLPQPARPAVATDDQPARRPRRLPRTALIGPHSAHTSQDGSAIDRLPVTHGCPCLEPATRTPARTKTRTPNWSRSNRCLRSGGASSREPCSASPSPASLPSGC